jgi:zinc D-Ala-D-Ala carboxypeptidase
MNILIQMNLTEKEKTLIESVLLRKDESEKNGIPLAILDFGNFEKMLTADELEVSKKIMRIEPSIYGFNGSFLGMSSVPSNLVAIDDQKYKHNEEEYIIPTQFIQKEIYEAYTDMNKKMGEEINKTILIESAYRSPAYQLLVFLYYLKQHNWDFSVTASRVALPGYSEHGYPPKQALDFITTNGIPNDKTLEKFSDTEEYKWLIENANDFGFYLSYPENNSYGIIFEPWHWSFQID